MARAPYQPLTPEPPSEERGSGPDLGNRLGWPGQGPSPLCILPPGLRLGTCAPSFSVPTLDPFGELNVCVRCLTY